MAILVDVEASEKGYYRFHQSDIAPGIVVVSRGTTAEKDHQPPDEYVIFQCGVNKGATAILRLMERAERLEQLFRDVCKIGICDLHGNRLTEFMSREDAENDDDEDFSDAYERIAELVEEQSLKEDIEAGRIGWRRD